MQKIKETEEGRKRLEIKDGEKQEWEAGKGRINKKRSGKDGRLGDREQGEVREGKWEKEEESNELGEGEREELEGWIRREECIGRNEDLMKAKDRRERRR